MGRKSSVRRVLASRQIVEPGVGPGSFLGHDRIRVRLRQRHTKGRALTLFADHVDLSVVQLDEFPDQRQANAASLPRPCCGRVLLPEACHGLSRALGLAGAASYYGSTCPEMEHSLPRAASRVEE